MDALAQGTFPTQSRPIRIIGPLAAGVLPKHHQPDAIHGIPINHFIRRIS